MERNCTSMPILPDYPGVSRIQTDKIKSEYFGRFLAFLGENVGYLMHFSDLIGRPLL